MITKTQAIKNYLSVITLPDLAALYNEAMECQVLVSQGKGSKVDGVYKGKSWVGYTDGVQTWKPFRIPYNAGTNPEYDLESQMTWDLAEHASAIGMTGWDWINKLSRWVAFDFDSILGHSEKHLAKLTDEELKRVEQAVSTLEYVTVRRSTSGHGLHLYVHLNVETANHNEHSALARAVLGKMAYDSGFDLASNVDICGGNMWVWRKNQPANAFELLKQGLELEDIPPNWREHIKVVTKSRRKTLPSSIRDSQAQSQFDILMGKMSKLKLDAEHERLLKWLSNNDKPHYWDTDNHMLITHTKVLQEAHDKLYLLGAFKTDSPGTDINKQNCFAIPLNDGAWVVRRFSLGCKEDQSWDQDEKGWTRTYLNRPLTIDKTVVLYGGVENEKGDFVFPSAGLAAQAMGQLGINVHIDPLLVNETAKIKRLKGDRLSLVIGTDARSLKNVDTEGWLIEKENLVKVYKHRPVNTPDRLSLLDDTVRYVVSKEGEEIGWYLYNEELSMWTASSIGNIKMMLKHSGMKAAEADESLGASVARPWVVVSEPFADEYIGERYWNKGGASLRYVPALEDAPTPTWDKIFSHLGLNLDASVKDDKWCRDNHITTGDEYLRLWVAALFQKPKSPLPYLFFFSKKQNTGKSIFHEALALLMTKGVIRANTCLDPSVTFNGELDGAILCVIEEIDLERSNKVYTRLKDWVTAVDIGIHAKGETTYSVPNTTHWVQMANNQSACPVFEEDTRVVVIEVNPLDFEIPKDTMLAMLAQEAPAFLKYVFEVEIPSIKSRLTIPAIHTNQKQAIINSNTSSLAIFLNTKCVYAPGYAMRTVDFMRAFHSFLNDPEEEAMWKNRTTFKQLPAAHAMSYASWGPGAWIPNLRHIDADLYPSREICAGTMLIPDRNNSLVRENNETVAPSL